MILLSLVVIVVLIGIVFAYILTRDGELKTPTGKGMIDLDRGTFENFPLPDYAAKFVGGEYKSYLVEVEPGIKIHVLEVGSGYPVYMQHGVPTSGFLYRKVADELPEDQFRIIMPTLVGLGFSSKVPASQHTVDNHMRWINTLLNKLTLDGLIYLGHDWGGPIGMGALARSPELLEGAVMLDTVFDAPKENEKLPPPIRLIKTPVVGEILLEGLISIFKQSPKQQADPNSIPPKVNNALYERPVTESGNAKGPLAILRMAADGPGHPTAEQFRRVEAYVQGLNIPAEIVWGMNDPILGSKLPNMITNFPEASVTETTAGHFLQEEGGGPEAIAAAVQRVYAQIQKGKDL
ncbi:MAG: alpha/beta fold hydrolase [Chloroflexota bacterium]